MLTEKTRKKKSATFTANRVSLAFFIVFLLSSRRITKRFYFEHFSKCIPRKFVKCHIVSWTWGSQTVHDIHWASLYFESEPFSWEIPDVTFMLWWWFSTRSFKISNLEIKFSWDSRTNSRMLCSLGLMFVYPQESRVEGLCVLFDSDVCAIFVSNVEEVVIVCKPSFCFSYFNNILVTSWMNSLKSHVPDDTNVLKKSDGRRKNFVLVLKRCQKESVGKCGRSFPLMRWCQPVYRSLAIGFCFVPLGLSSCLPWRE
jgi:hypothetical protein